MGRQQVLGIFEPGRLEELLGELEARRLLTPADTSPDPDDAFEFGVGFEQVAHGAAGRLVATDAEEVLE